MELALIACGEVMTEFPDKNYNELFESSVKPQQNRMTKEHLEKRSVKTDMDSSFQW